jgi:hypothetical protein
VEFVLWRLQGRKKTPLGYPFNPKRADSGLNRAAQGDFSGGKPRRKLVAGHSAHWHGAGGLCPTDRTAIGSDPALMGNTVSFTTSGETKY